MFHRNREREILVNAEKEGVSSYDSIFEQIGQMYLLKQTDYHS